MRAYVCDVIRSSLCNLTLDEAFESKEDIANELKKHLSEVMTGYGISIVTALVTDLSPDSKVRNAMNEINGKWIHLFTVLDFDILNLLCFYELASKRLKESALQRAEGEKILRALEGE